MCKLYFGNCYFYSMIEKIVKQGKLHLILFLLLGTLWGNEASAQIGWRIGLNAGPVFSRIGTSIDSIPSRFDNKTNVGFALGLTAHYGFSDATGLEIGVNLVNKGYTIKNDSNNVEDKLKSSFTNIEIPVSFTLRQDLNGYSFMREKVGFTLGIHTEAEDTILQTAGDGANFTATEIITKRIYPMFNIGLEYGYLTDNGNAIIVGLDYSQGLGSNVDINYFNNESRTNSLFDLGYRGSNLMLRVAYMFNLGNATKKDEFFY
jgi:hypothetical protein